MIEISQNPKRIFSHLRVVFGSLFVGIALLLAPVMLFASIRSGLRLGQLVIAGDSGTGRLVELIPTSNKSSKESTPVIEYRVENGAFRKSIADSVRKKWCNPTPCVGDPVPTLRYGDQVASASVMFCRNDCGITQG